MGYTRQNIDRLEPYMPGDQPDGKQIIKLNTNENPFVPCDAVLEAIRGVSGEMLRRYPPPTADAFRRAAAQVHGVSPSMVIATNGGDELLRLAVTVFCEPGLGGGGLAVSDPTYSLYHTLAQIHGSTITRIPLTAQWELPDDFADRCIRAGCRLVMIVNPHAPTGKLRALDQLESIAAKLRGHCILLIDEAYVDFAEHDAVSLLSLTKGLDNILLLRTLSKGYSLAGLRFGYGLGPAELVAALDKARDSYNTDVIAQKAAITALQYRQEAAKTWQAVRSERTRLTQELLALAYDVLPSDSNFLLVKPPDTGPNAAAIFLSLKKKGIYVRYFDQDRLRDRLRITIGSIEQNDKFIAALNTDKN